MVDVELDELVSVTPSYWLNQLPDVGLQSPPTATPLPSRLSTVSRVLHVPAIVIQCGKRSRE